MTRAEMDARGWDEVDIVFVTGDAYVDHPSFAMALLGRLLEDEGFRVAILSQPDWHSCEPWRTFGKPRLFFAVSAGNMDSMINHYTANRKVRNDDAYSPGGRIGRRPDRCTLAYCQRAREAYKGVPIIAGGVEASLRRIAHYDYWSDKVRRSIVLDAKCDLLVYGMGERPIIEIAHQLAAGATRERFAQPPRRGLSTRRKEALNLARSPAMRTRATGSASADHTIRSALAQSTHPSPLRSSHHHLPSYETVSGDDAKSKRTFCTLTKIAHQETNPHNAKRLVQFHGPEAVVVNPGALPLTQAEMDRVYGLPFTRLPHPSYGARKNPGLRSRQAFRANHARLLRRLHVLQHHGPRRAHHPKPQPGIGAGRNRTDARTQPDFTGVVSDIGGPTANMYEMKCTPPRSRSRLPPAELRASDDLQTAGHRSRPARATDAKSPRAARREKSARRLGHPHGSGPPRSGLHARTGEASRRRPFESRPRTHRPRRAGPDEKTVATTISKSSAPTFKRQSKAAGKKQYLMPYYIASHPGSDLNAMIDLALFLKRNHYQPDQVQDFIPSPFDIAACMYHTGYDPFTMKPVYIAKHLRDRRLQRALLQFFKPENYFEVRQALEKAGRQDLIGNGCDCLIPERPPKEALSRRRRKANDQLRETEGDHIRSKAPSPSARERARGEGRWSENSCNIQCRLSTHIATSANRQTLPNKHASV